MQKLDILYHVTKELKKVLDQPITSKNREAIIKEMNLLIEKRGNTMEHITPPFTEEEKLIGQEIVVLNEQIKKKMNHLFEELKQDMRLVNKQKESNRSYINPYRNMKSTDGMYLDSKQ